MAWVQVYLKVYETIRPFCFCEEPLGNINESGLKEIGNNSVIIIIIIGAYA